LLDNGHNQNRAATICREVAYWRNRANDLREVTREASFALWNALLTLDGIVVTVSSAIAVLGEKRNAAAIFVALLSAIAAVLIILNFRSIRDAYKRVGKMTAEEIAQMIPDKRNQELQGAVNIHDNRRLRENWSFVLLAADAVVIIWILWRR
jgi:hypothetical protein